MKSYQVCTRCLMDNKSDETIFFDSNGYCNYCSNAFKNLPSIYFPNKLGEEKLTALINQIKSENINNEYDCLMGISGGLDSSYLAYLGSAKWGLRILAVHIDDGFDTQISKSNISNLCKSANLDLVTISPDRNQFNELTRAYLLAGVPNLAAPQDNILFAHIYKYMREKKIKLFLSGGNFALESILQDGNTHDAYDLVNIRDINNNFGRNKIDKLEFISNFQRDLDKFIFGIKSLRPLNYINYNRENAIRELATFCDFQYYGSKHLENILTKFTQLYWMYEKFDVDKRKSHLSSMIVSDQLTREEGLKLLSEPMYCKKDMQHDIDFILDTFDLSHSEFEAIMNESPKSHFKFKTSQYNKLRNFIRLKL